MKMIPSNLLASICLFSAILHIFLAPPILKSKKRLHLHSSSFVRACISVLTEIELIFTFWTVIFLVTLCINQGVFLTLHELITHYSFREPLIVGLLMILSASPWVLGSLDRFVLFSASKLPFSPNISLYIVLLMVAPLLGSFITEPATMTVCAYLLKDHFFTKKVSQRFKYMTLGLLFVNTSIGGTLTSYAAPPIFMVARTWNWDSWFVFKTFGIRSIFSCFVATSMTLFFLKRELLHLPHPHRSHALKDAHSRKAPWRSSFFRAGLLVLFLSSLVILGEKQVWWLEHLLPMLSHQSLFIGASILSSFTDNVALTYLGSRLPSLAESSRYFLVAGSLVGGGLTVLGNAPNPLGYGILKDSFGQEGIRPERLFLAALVPTLVAFCIYWI